MLSQSISSYYGINNKSTESKRPHTMLGVKLKKNYHIRSFYSSKVI